MKTKIRIFDTSFPYVPSCTLNNESRYIEWDRTSNIKDGDIVFFTDSSLNLVNSISMNCKKIGWLIEPPEVNYDNYQFVINNYEKFDLILTHQQSLLSISNKFKPLPMWCSWIKPENQIIAKKNKDISIIVSNKRDTFGHKLRHDTVNRFSSNYKIDLFGFAYNRIEDKSTALSDYRFSIIIENAKSDYLFTEKLVDCLVTGTVPIYWGANKIGDFFDLDGFFTFNDIEELNSILTQLNEEKYEELLPIVKKNFDIASKYVTVEDYIYEKYLLNTL